MSPERLEEIKKMMGIDPSNNDFIYVEGIGYVFENGKLNMEAFIRRMLKSEYITTRH